MLRKKESSDFKTLILLFQKPKLNLKTRHAIGGLTLVGAMPFIPENGRCRMDMDRAYANGAFIQGAADFVPKWTAEAAAFRQGLGARAQVNLPYGTGARQWFDLFLPVGAPRGVLVFVHGGYWMEFDPKSWSHLAAGALARGWACAMPCYTLAPEAKITTMTREISCAIDAIGERVAGPIVVSGHSAGGHLAARMGCADVALRHRPRRVVPISPLADLAPLIATQMNATLRLDAQEARAESPAYLPRHGATDAHIWVGGQERPAFLWQARVLSEEWDCPWTVAPDLHHFDVIDGLAHADSALLAACLDGL